MPGRSGYRGQFLVILTAWLLISAVGLAACSSGDTTTSTAAGQVSDAAATTTLSSAALSTAGDTAVTSLPRWL